MKKLTNSAKYNSFYFGVQNAKKKIDCDVQTQIKFEVHKCQFFY